MNNMDAVQAKQQLQEFLGGREITFSIREHDGGEWIAECNEIPAIMTGGLVRDIAKIDSLIRDAILTAAGVDTKYAHDIISFVGYRPVNKVMGFLRNEQRENKEAQYVVLERV